MSAAEQEVEPLKICCKPRCNKRGEPQPLTNFYRHAGFRDGRRRECKKCHNEHRASWARARYVPVTGRRIDVSPAAKLKRATLKAGRDERRAARVRRRNEASVQPAT